MIFGPAGAGKSALALQLMALGASLVADDRTELRCSEGMLTAHCPSAIQGMIEARGIGILAAPARDQVPLVLAVDLGQSETERLPPRRKISLLGQNLDLVYAIQANHFPSALLCYLRGMRLQ